MQSSLSTATFHKGKHLDIDDLKAPLSHCPICLSDSNRRKKILLQRQPEVHLLYCNNCNGYSASRMPTQQALARYYGSYYPSAQDKVTFHGVDRLANHIRRSIAEPFFQTIEKIRILDFGGGNGSLALNFARAIGELYAKHIDVVLVDYNEENPFTHDRISFSSFKSLEEIEGTFDIILASAVLEHIPDLNSVVCQLAGRLRPLGYFYARTPYVLPFKQIFQFLDFTYPGHVHDLGPAFWNRFTQTFSLPWSTVLSQTSPVQTQLHEAFVRTLISMMCKIPSWIEQKISGPVLINPAWPFVGGWEVLFKSS